MRNSQVYFFFTLLSFPFIGLNDAGASIMRAQNNSRNPMVISVISNFMNIGGNAILIFPSKLYDNDNRAEYSGYESGNSSSLNTHAEAENQNSVAADIHKELYVYTP